MRLPYEFSLSHHQLLFNVFNFIFVKANMEILFTKSKQNDIFTRSSISALKHVYTQANYKS
jgi:hypothetical protein